MPTIKIVADSTCDLPPDLLKKYNIDLIPINVIFNGTVFPQTMISTSEFYHRVAAGELPSTGVPSPKTFKDAYEKALLSADKVLVFTVAGSLSGVHSTASMVAKQFFNQGVERVLVIDTKSITLQFGLIVIEAARMIQQNYPLEAILSRLDQLLIPNSHLLGAIENLSFLKRGGRISNVTWLLGSLLSVKPVIHITNGQLVSPCKVLGRDHALSLLQKALKPIFDNLLLDTFIVGYSKNEERGKALLDFVSVHPNCPSELLFGEIGPAMAAHIGPDAVGYAWVGHFKNKWL